MQPFMKFLFGANWICKYLCSDGYYTFNPQKSLEIEDVYIYTSPNKISHTTLAFRS